MPLKNLTTKHLTFHTTHQEADITITIQPETSIRLGTKPEVHRETIEVMNIKHAGIAIQVTEDYIGGTSNLPHPTHDTYYIVSKEVATANPDRLDLLIPEGQVYDNQGQVTGYRQLARIPTIPSSTTKEL